ncbi:MAG: hypothetical protein ACJAZO_001891 [Myxococcota bacterium]|jgi:hypothetical protein
MNADACSEFGTQVVGSEWDFHLGNLYSYNIAGDCIQPLIDISKGAGPQQYTGQVRATTTTKFLSNGKQSISHSERQEVL